MRPDADEFLRAFDARTGGAVVTQFAQNQARTFMQALRGLASRGLDRDELNLLADEGPDDER